MTAVDLGPQARRLLSRLRKAGFSSAFLMASLPDWWEAGLELEPGLWQELKLGIARRLGLDIAAFVSDEVVTPRLPAGVRFKRGANISAETGEPLVAFCATLARSVTSLMSEPSAEVDSAEDLRREILSSGAKWISLNALLQYAWERLKISVISVQASPTQARGFDAVTFKINNRVCIILTKQTAQRAWLAFILAHELGHLALGHIHDEEILADREILGEQSSALGKDDDEEAANRYALALLGGEVQFVVGNRSGIPDVRSAILAGTETQVDPGHLILRYARGTGNWAGAQRALDELHKSARQPPAPDFVNEIASKILPVEALADEVSENLLSAMHGK